MLAATFKKSLEGLEDVAEAVLWAAICSGGVAICGGGEVHQGGGGAGGNFWGGKSGEAGLAVLRLRGGKSGVEGWQSGVAG